MISLKPFYRVRELIFYIDDTACDDGSENDFIEVSTGDDVKPPDSFFDSSKSTSEQDRI